MEMKNFIAKYSLNGIQRTVQFDGSRFDKTKAEQLLAANNIQNFFFFFDENEFVDMPDGSVMISGEVGFDITLNRLKPYLDEGKRIILDSGGGSLWEGLRIYDYIKEFTPGAKIGTLGLNASAATLPLVAAKKENRSGSSNSRFLIHNPWTFAVGDADDFRIKAEELQLEETNLVAIYVKELGKSEEEVKAQMKPEKIMTSQDALNFGLIGEIKGGSVEQPVNNKPKIENVKMTNEEAKGFLDKLGAKFDALMNLIKPKNIVLQDVNGVELDFGADVTSEEQIVVGITGVTAAGAPANGDYTFPSGKVVKIEAGTVTEVTMQESEDAAVQQLQTENALLKHEIVNLKAEKETLSQTNATLNAEVTKTIGEFTAFRNQFSKGGIGAADVPPVGSKSSQKENRSPFKKQ